MKRYDLIIAGAGPAGSTLALNLADSGLNIAVLDKDIFPRKKICGDALSGKTLNILRHMPGNIYLDFLANVEKEPSHGIRFVAPNLKELDLPFVLNSTIDHEPSGYICPRYCFDEFLFNKLSYFENITIFQGTKISGISIKTDFVSVRTDHGEIQGKLIAGADGTHSMTRELATPGPLNPYQSVGIRSYFKKVTGIHPDNFIELIFLRELLPGYFWIFNGPSGLTNVGLGMPHRQIIKRKVNLSRLLLDLVENHPYLAPRFHTATLIDKPEAHILPIGTLKIRRSGNRFLLLGDAAFLVDPFSCEGIGNAMTSGECANQVIRNCFKKNSFSGCDLSEYDQKLERRLGKELRISGTIRKLSCSPGLFNFVINKARKNKEIKELLSGMYTNENLRAKLTKPSFYFNLILR